MRGLQLAKAMREILDHPEKVLADVKEQEPTIEVQLQDEIAYLREYQKREQVAGWKSWTENQYSSRLT